MQRLAAQRNRRTVFRAALSWGRAAKKCAQLVHCIVYKPDGKRAVMICAGGPMATLTTHVLNIATGIPAAGMRIELRALTPASPAAPTVSRTNADGRCPAPLLEGDALRA